MLYSKSSCPVLCPLHVILAPLQLPGWYISLGFVIIQPALVPTGCRGQRWTGTMGCSSPGLGLPTWGQPEALRLHVTCVGGTQQINCPRATGVVSRKERLGFMVRYAGAVEEVPVGAFKHGFLLFKMSFYCCSIWPQSQLQHGDLFLLLRALKIKCSFFFGLQWRATMCSLLDKLVKAGIWTFGELIETLTNLLIAPFILICDVIFHLFEWVYWSQCSVNEALLN